MAVGVQPVVFLGSSGWQFTAGSQLRCFDTFPYGGACLPPSVTLGDASCSRHSAAFPELRRHLSVGSASSWGTTEMHSPGAYDKVNQRHGALSQSHQSHAFLSPHGRRSCTSQALEAFSLLPQSTSWTFASNHHQLPEESRRKQMDKYKKKTKEGRGRIMWGGFSPPSPRPSPPSLVRQ